VTEPAAIEVERVGKRYTKYEDTPMLISSVLQLRNRSRRSSLWALRDANFTVARGECIGVIGRNGSGKSTLLQMLAGVTAPTEGRVTVRGRVAPLISVGVGFHPELTGRENVYVNATILGLDRTEVDERFDEIVAFSEIGDFIDTPVKFYSSGMFVRLGFSVSVLAEPDVLLIDEVLAVGDLAFQMKCFERMERLRSDGTTIVLVTHNLNAVRRLCDRTLVIHNGEQHHDGDTVEAMSLFHELIGDHGGEEATDRPRTAPSAGDLAAIEDFALVGRDETQTHHIDSSQQVTVVATVRVRGEIASPFFSFVVASESGINVYEEHFVVDGPLEPGQVLPIRIAFQPDLATGSYSLHLGLASVNEAVAGAPDPVLFFATGRPLVRGVADLHAVLTTDVGGQARPDRSTG